MELQVTSADVGSIHAPSQNPKAPKASIPITQHDGKPVPRSLAQLW